MEILSHAVRIHPGPSPDATTTEAELDRLRAQLAWLQAERVALWWAVGHDELTGLPNRRLLHTVAPGLLRAAAGSAVVLVMDLNGFKQINDRFGHDTGDTVLRTVAQRLSSWAGDNLVVRLGGDEFVAVLTGSRTRPPEQVRPGSSGFWWQRALTALTAAIAEPMPVAGRMLHVTASIGVTPGFADAGIEELLRRADLAMYRAKAAGRCDAVWGTDLVGNPTCPTASAADVPAPGSGTGGTGGTTVVEMAVFPAPPHRDTAPPVTAGDVPHQDRDRAPGTPDGARHRCGDPVWVHRHGCWLPGIVEAASARAVTVTYRYAAGPATAVDTMSTVYVRPRTSNQPPAPPTPEPPSGTSQGPFAGWDGSADDVTGPLPQRRPGVAA